MVERARIVLACLEGKEIQQVAKDLDSSSPTVSKWRKRFGQQGLIGLRDHRGPESLPSALVRSGTGFWCCSSNRRQRGCRIGMGTHGGAAVEGQRTCGLARDRQAQRITAEVVLLLARAAAKDSRDAA